jgi:hypothetical protein
MQLYVDHILQLPLSGIHQLYVGKWENAFKRDNPGKKPPNISLVNNFTARDPDSFQIYVKDPAAREKVGAFGTVDVRLSTSSDRGTTIKLTAADAVQYGYFTSDYLLLASFSRDKVQSLNRIFLVRLGDWVKATYDGQELDAKVPIKNVVKLHIDILRDKKKADGGKGVTSDDNVKLFRSVANQVYAQAGIRFEFEGGINIVDPPPGVDLSNGLESFLTNQNNAGGIPMTTEEKDLLDAFEPVSPANKNYILVLFVNFLAKNGVENGYSGEAFTAEGVPNPKYADSIILSAKRANPSYVLAHEIGHVLLNSGEHPDKDFNVNLVNLMVSGAQSNATVTDSRRITAKQAEDMLSKRPNLLSKP